jgi:dTDP-4-amino-4,6-dideoxygalactose transaminase
MRVALLDLRAQHAEVAVAVEEAVRRVLAGGQYILGEDVAALERELAALHGVAHAIGVSSGTDALLATLSALGIARGDEVVTSAFSFFATAGAIARLGATPVFADVDAGSFNLDPADALRRVGPRTRAIVPVHLFGRVADTDPLGAAGVPIVEDAAQALGAPAVGKRGRAATLSFFPSKNLGAAGDAGMVLTDDAELAAQVRLLRTHGSKPKYVHHIVGGNFRIDTLQAAILRAKLPLFAEWNRRRRANADAYRAALAGLPLALPDDAPGHMWHHFVVRAAKGTRDALRAHLVAREIETEVYYPRPLHLQPCFAHLDGKCGDLPQAERAAEEVLALPVHPQLDEPQRAHVATAVRSFYGG